jgi:uncharacterized membrane protein
LLVWLLAALVFITALAQEQQVRLTLAVLLAVFRLVELLPQQQEAEQVF